MRNPHDRGGREEQDSRPEAHRVKRMKTLYLDIVVAGCSTPLYADDGFGSAVVECPPGLELITKLAKEKINKNRKMVEERKTLASTRRCWTLSLKLIFFNHQNYSRYLHLIQGWNRFSSPSCDSISVTYPSGYCKWGCQSGGGGTPRASTNRV